MHWNAAFVGREEQLAVLRAAFKRASDGSGSIVTVVGEPGIGKTALTQSLAREVADSARVLEGHCNEDTAQPLPYMPFVDALSGWPHRSDDDGVREALGDGAAYVARVVPGLAQRLGLNLPAATNPDYERWSLLEAITDLLAALAMPDPLVLVLEDRLAAYNYNGAMRYVHQDHLGSTAFVTDANGALVYEASYDPWGNVRTSSGTLDMDRTFTGQRFDAATGLYRRSSWRDLLDDAAKRRFTVLLVFKLDRAFRSVKHMHDTLDALQIAGVAFRSAREQIDTSTAYGRLLLNLLATLAEFELELIRERVKAGMDRARRQGKHIGRPSVWDKRGFKTRCMAVCERVRAGELSRRQAAKELGIGYATLKRYLDDPAKALV